jgi:hypothetical protein
MWIRCDIIRRIKQMLGKNCAALLQALIGSAAAVTGLADGSASGGVRPLSFPGKDRPPAVLLPRGLQACGCRFLSNNS